MFTSYCYRLSYFLLKGQMSDDITALVVKFDKDSLPGAPAHCYYIYIYIYMYACNYMYMYIHVCMCISLSLYIYIYTYIYIYIEGEIHTCVRTY